ncbi:MAG: [FeFe] hydrogenase H-cluster maturation GTPase HydF [Polyangiaceae bacterium]|nr:[FeFe] hydrogenase H-cluster maturation GTPase HydF [Polyangiaceae bacterium]
MSGRGAPRGMRLHIGIFGRRNVGKSSLLNAIVRQDVSIVSEVAGTTTDPVEKPMELLPLGPVLFVDTAGIDDQGGLGERRVQRTRQVLDRVDVAVVVVADGWGSFEIALLGELRARGTPALVVANKTDTWLPPAALLAELDSMGVPHVQTCATRGEGILALREALLAAAPADFLDGRGILADLVGPGGMAVLVVPIDKEAPKGRLILPQVQSIRDLLDADALCMVTKERELRAALERLKQPPQLVVTDSQALLKVAADTPPGVPMTSFSILFARHRGDLTSQVEGALAIDRLKPGDRVLIAEACAHHPIGEDIGRVKIPRWLTQYVGGKLEFVTVQGHDFPEDLSTFQLVVHCGACTLNRREVLSRILRCRQLRVPITNYGLAIAFSLGIFERALSPFPAALDLWRSATRREEPP